MTRIRFRPKQSPVFRARARGKYSKHKTPIERDHRATERVGLHVFDDKRALAIRLPPLQPNILEVFPFAYGFGFFLRATLPPFPGSGP